MPTVYKIFHCIGCKGHNYLEEGVTRCRANLVQELGKATDCKLCLWCFSTEISEDGSPYSVASLIVG